MKRDVLATDVLGRGGKRGRPPVTADATFLFGTTERSSRAGSTTVCKSSSSDGPSSPLAMVAAIPLTMALVTCTFLETEEAPSPPTESRVARTTFST